MWTPWLQRDRTAKRGLFVCLAFLSIAATSAAAQRLADPTIDPPAEDADTDQAWIAYFESAFKLSAKAKILDEHTRVVEMCEVGLDREDDLPKDYPGYARRLLAWSLNKRGELLDEDQQPTEALEDFQRAVELDPRNWRAIHNRGVSLAQSGKYKEAMADFDRTIDLQRRFVKAYFNRGELRYELGQFAEAIEDYNLAIRLRPDDSAAYNSRGHAYYRLGNYRGALDDYTAAIRTDSGSAAAYTNRGDAYADLGYFAQAARDYRTAIRLDPELGRAYQSAAWLMSTCPDERYRDARRAVAVAERAIELDGDADYRYLDTLAAAYASAGQFEAARGVQAQVVAMAPDAAVERYRQRLALYQKDYPYRTGLATQQTPGALSDRR